MENETFLVKVIEDVEFKVTIKPMENDYVIYVTTPNSYFSRWDCGYAYDMEFINNNIDTILHSLIHPVAKHTGPEAYSCYYKFKGTKLQLVCPTINGDIYFG